MGWTFTALGPEDQTHLRQLIPEIVKAFNKAPEALRTDPGRAHCRIWFGDDDARWLNDLGQYCSRAGSIVNLADFEVYFAPLLEREIAENAAAFPPNNGWRVYLRLADAQTQHFRVRLNSAWNRAPLYNVGQANLVQSRFEILVHEITHLLLNSFDCQINGQTAYGARLAEELARVSPNQAKINAENWGFFIEGLRTL